MKTLSILICNLILLIQVAIGMEKTTVDLRYEAALALPDSGSISEKIQTFKGILKDYDNYAPAHNQLAWLYLKQGKPETRQYAQRAIDRALVLDPDNLTYQLTQGAVMWSRHRYDRAVAHYEALLAKHPDCIDAAYWLSYYHLHEFLEAKDRRETESSGPSRVGRATQGSDVIGRSISDLSRLESLSSAYLESMVKTNGFGVFEFSMSAEIHWDDTRDYAGKCLGIDPNFKDAYYILGLLNLENGRPDRLVAVMLRLLERHPEDKDGLLFCGLGYLAQGFPGRADEYFAKSLALMSAEERAILENIDLIENKKKRSDHEAFQVRDDTEDHARFWQSQDPLFLTPYNERRMEHYARLAYANLRFSQPRAYIQGYCTDMGQTYIKFGRYRLRQTTRQSETWIYENFNLSFLNTQKGGLGGRIFNWTSGYVVPPATAVRNSRDPWAFNDGGDGYRAREEAEERQSFLRLIPDYLPPTVREAFKANEPRYLDPYRKQRYTLPYLATAFREQDSIRFEVAYAIPKQYVKPLDDGSRGVMNGVFLFDENWQEQYRDAKGLVWPGGKTDDDGSVDHLRDQYMTMQHTLQVAPGDYLLTAEVVDPRSFAIGSFRKYQTIDQIHDRFAMSDLLLASDIKPKVAFPEARLDLDIVPNPLRSFRKYEPVFIYFEFYNLNQNMYDRTQYQISYRISLPKEKEIDPTLFDASNVTEGVVKIRELEQQFQVDGIGDGFGQFTQPETAPIYEVTYEVPKHNLVKEWIKKQTRGLFRKRHETMISAQYEGQQKNDFTYLQIDVAQIPAGIHKLTVTVRDISGDKEAEKSLLFRIVE